MLEPGDIVTSILPDGTLGFGEITAKRTFEVNQLLILRLDNGTQLGVTGTHPIAIGAEEYRPAGDLTVGDRVLLAMGDTAITDIETRIEPRDVIDFTVSPHQNFIANNVVTHNKTMISAPTKETVPGQYFSPRAKTALEITEIGGRIRLARLSVANGTTTEVDSDWQITSWTLDRYTLTAKLQRDHPKDWLSNTMPEPVAILTLQMVGPRHIWSFRISTPSYTYGVPGMWLTEEQMDSALTLLETP